MLPDRPERSGRFSNSLLNEEVDADEFWESDEGLRESTFFGSVSDDFESLDSLLKADGLSLWGLLCESCDDLLESLEGRLRCLGGDRLEGL